MQWEILSYYNNFHCKTEKEENVLHAYLIIGKQSCKTLIEKKSHNICQITALPHKTLFLNVNSNLGFFYNPVRSEN